MTARTVLPGDPGYDDLRRPEIARFADVRPAAVIRCATPGDVAEAVAAARAAARPVAVRGGGHCFAGRSSTDGVLIDVRPMTGVTVSGEQAVIRAGTRLGEVYDVLAAHGRTIPAGCGPSVGIAGLTLGGGLGILGRTYGLTCDSLRAATVVLADGRTVVCDERHEPELFWALRGGGAPGVVTDLTFATVPAPDSTAFRMMFPPAGAADVLAAWQDAAPDAPDAVAASLVLFTSSDITRPPAVAVFGAVLGEPAAGAAAVDDLIRALGAAPLSDRRRHGTHRATKHQLSEVDPHDGGPEPADGHTYLRSGFHRRPVVAAALVEQLFADRRPGESRELDLSPWGGAYNRVEAEATAFPHRDARFLLKHAATVAGGADPTGAIGWLTGSYELARPHGTGGVYPNFPEPGLPDTAYHGGNTARLRRVRDTYDPDGLFRGGTAAG